jgi:large subunit ribosomal protein L35
MPKIKTNRAAAKRFRATGSGGFKRKKAYHSHLLASKSTKRKRGLRAGAMVDKANLGGIKRLLPYL